MNAPPLLRMDFGSFLDAIPTLLNDSGHERQKNKTDLQLTTAQIGPCLGEAHGFYHCLSDWTLLSNHHPRYT